MYDELVKRLRETSCGAKDTLWWQAADVVPVVRGKWTRIDYEPHGHDYKCSACGWKNDMPTHYCPNCGAKMEES